MITKIVSILFFGTLFWLTFDFIFYSGLFVNYIQANDIPIFFNRFFMENQIWWLWIVGIVIYGTIFMMRNRKKEKMLFYLISTLLAGVPWIPSFGEQIGLALFSKHNVTYRFGKVLIEDATILYESGEYDYVKVPGKQITLRYPKKNRIQ